MKKKLISRFLVLSILASVLYFSVFAQSGVANISPRQICQVQCITKYTQCKKANPSPFSICSARYSMCMSFCGSLSNTAIDTTPVIDPSDLTPLVNPEDFYVREYLNIEILINQQHIWIVGN